jgi:hypothetical protein
MWSCRWIYSILEEIVASFLYLVADVSEELVTSIFYCEGGDDRFL